MTETDGTGRGAATDALGARTVVRAGWIYGAQVIAAQAIGLALFPVYTHYIVPADFGVLEILWRTRDVLFLLVSSAVGATTVAFFRFESSDAGRRRIIGMALVLQAAGSATVLAFGIAAARVIHATMFGEDQLVDLTRLMIVVTAADLTHRVPLAYWMATFEAGKHSLFSTLIPMTGALLVVIAIVVLDMGLYGVLLAWAVNSVAYAVVMNAIVLRRVGLDSLRPRLAKVWEMLRYGLPLVPNGMMSFILNNGDRYFLLHYRTNAEVGLYGAGYRIGTLLEMGLMVPFTKLWIPTIIELSKREGGPRTIARMATGFLFVYGLAGVVLVAVSREIVDLLAPPSYSSIVAVVPLIVLAYYFFAMLSLFDGSIYISKRVVLKPIVGAATTATVLLLYWLLIPPHGMTGAAVATVCAFLLGAALTGIVGRRVYPIPFEYLKVALIPLVACASLGPLLWLRYPDYDLPVTWKLGAVGAYLLLAFALRIVTPTSVSELVSTVLGRRREA